MAKQIKKCTDSACTNAQPKKHVSAKFMYCPLCGAKLTYVCASCGQPIEVSAEDKKTCLCKACADAKEEKKIQTKQVAVAAGAGAAAVAGTVVGMKVVMPVASNVKRIKELIDKYSGKKENRDGFGGDARD